MTETHLNREREEFGRIAAQAFAEACSMDLEREPDTVLCDLLVCLRCFAEKTGVNFGDLDEAAAHFHAESKIAPGGWVSALS